MIEIRYLAVGERCLWYFRLLEKVSGDSDHPLVRWVHEGTEFHVDGDVPVAPVCLSIPYDGDFR